MDGRLAELQLQALDQFYSNPMDTEKKNKVSSKRIHLPDKYECIHRKYCKTVWYVFGFNRHNQKKR